MSESKLTNPKDAVGSDKLPLELTSSIADVYISLAMLVGKLKYGSHNFRPAGASAKVYVGALRRHTALWWEGQECDDETGLPHLAHMLACVLILAEAKENGNLVDDRPYRSGYVDLVKRMTPHVKRLKELFADRDPKHWTIQDNPAQEAK